MPITTAASISDMDLDYPSDNGLSSTASLSWAAIQEVKRPALAGFPNLSSEVSANAGELHSLKGLGGVLIVDMLADTSSSLVAHKLDLSATAVAALTWGGANKFVQSATPSSPADGDLWFQT